MTRPSGEVKPFGVKLLCHALLAEVPPPVNSHRRQRRCGCLSVAVRLLGGAICVDKSPNATRVWRDAIEWQAVPYGTLRGVWIVHHLAGYAELHCGACILIVFRPSEIGLAGIAGTRN